MPLLKTCSLPGSVLSSGNIAVDKTDKNPYFCSACEMFEYEENKHMKWTLEWLNEGTNANLVE